MRQHRSATHRDEPLNIRLEGSEFEPGDDPRWVISGEDTRRRYWAHIADYALDVKRREVRRAIGKTGRKFQPVLKSSRPDGAKGPPLIPHYGESRTQRLLAKSSTASSATIYWRAEGGKSWARIMGFHTYKHGPRSLPVRPVIGISPGGLRAIRADARDWWDRTQGPPIAPPEPKPSPKPVPPKPMPRRPVAIPPSPPPKPAAAQVTPQPKPRPVPPPRAKRVPTPKPTPPPAPPPKPPVKRARKPVAKPAAPPPVIPPPVVPKPVARPVAPPPVKPVPVPPPPVVKPVVPKPAPPVVKPVPAPTPTAPQAFQPKPPPVVPPPPVVKPVPPPVGPKPNSLPPPFIPGVDYIKSSADWARAQGIRVEEAGNAFMAKSKGMTPKRLSRVPAAYAQSTKTVYINEQHPYWQDPQAFVDKQYAQAWFSQGKDNHAIVHEVGHAVHHKEIGDQNFRKVKEHVMKPTEADLIRKEVSHYGATEPLELIAEVYVAMKNGKTFSPQVMSLYHKYGGPSV